MHGHLYTPQMPGSHKGQKRALEILKLHSV